jgi:hypothetical protein
VGLWCLVRFGRVRQRQLRSRPQHLRNPRASHQNGDRTIDRVLKEHACRLPGEEPFPIREKGVGIPGALGNAPRFRARPRTTAPRGPLPQAHRSPVPDPAGAKRPAGRCPGALGPRRAWDQRGTVAGAMDPATAAVKGLLSMRAETGNALRFPRPRGTVPQRPVQPAPTEASARRGRGGRWPGALGPRLAWGRRGAVAGAMASAMAAVKVLSLVRAGPGNALRFPRPRGTVPRRPAGPGITKGQRPTRRAGSARRVGAGAGRGLWAPGWPGFSGALWQGRWPLPLQRGWWFGV